MRQLLSGTGQGEAYGARTLRAVLPETRRSHGTRRARRGRRAAPERLRPPTMGPGEAAETSGPPAGIRGLG